MGNTKSDRATRLAASHFAKYATGLIGEAVRKHNISIVDLAIISLIFAESTAPIREEPYLGNRFGFEDRGLPNEYRAVINLKYIHSSLGLSRETARRRLEQLVDRGFITKTAGGYMFHHPHTSLDFAADFRMGLLNVLEFIVAEASRPRAPD